MTIRPIAFASIVACCVAATFAQQADQRDIDAPGNVVYSSEQSRALAAGYRFVAACDRPDAVFRAGERVTFTVTLLDTGGKPVDAEVKYGVLKDGLDPKGATARPGADGTFSVDGGTLDQPGFLQFEATWTPKDATRPLTARAGAAFDREKIQPSLPPPDDFDQFWADQRAKLAAVPMNLRVTPVKQKDATIEVFDVQADIGDGAPGLSGYLARPVGAKDKTLPAIVFCHGAGVASARMDMVTEFAKNGMLVLDFNAHGIPNGQPPAFYAGLRTGELKEYQARGKESRDTIYFRTVFLRMLRAVDVLTQRPEWDGTHVIACGRSQGGAMGLAAGGIDARVTAVVAEIPGMCDLTGPLAGRVPAWPRYLPATTKAKVDPKIVEAARYYDATNFASRTKVPTFVTLGWCDFICPPTGVYAAINQLKGPRQVLDLVTLAHVRSVEGDAFVRKAIKEHVAPKAAHAK